MSKKLPKTTTSKSKPKAKGKDIGWGIDQAKYDEARKPKPNPPTS